MKIKFSRHAKRRGKLYGITEDTVIQLLKREKLIAGKHEIVANVDGFRFPLKVVIDVHDGIITIITNYPLKQEKKNESLL